MFMFSELLTKLSMHMPKFMTNGHHPFPYLLCMHVQKKKSPMLCLVGFSLPQIFLCLGPLGFNYDFFVNTLPSSIIESRYLPNINWNPIQCEHGFGFFMFWVLSPWHGSRISFLMFWYSNPQRRNKWLFRVCLNLNSYDLSMSSFKTQKIIWFNGVIVRFVVILQNVARKRCYSGNIVAMKC
jgi:hypothetical protein